MKEIERPISTEEFISIAHLGEYFLSQTIKAFATLIIAPTSAVPNNSKLDRNAYKALKHLEAAVEEFEI